METWTPLNDAAAAGYTDGRAAGWSEGYAAGFRAGADVGAARILIHGPVPDLSSAYVDWRAQLDTGPCNDPRCGACAVRRDWLSRNRADFPGRRG